MQNNGFHRCWSPHIHTSPGQTLRSALSGGLLVGNNKWGSQVHVVKAVSTILKSKDYKKKNSKIDYLEGGPNLPHSCNFALPWYKLVIWTVWVELLKRNLHERNTTFVHLLPETLYFRSYPWTIITAWSTGWSIIEAVQWNCGCEIAATDNHARPYNITSFGLLKNQHTFKKRKMQPNTQKKGIYTYPNFLIFGLPWWGRLQIKSFNKAQFHDKRDSRVYFDSAASLSTRGKFTARRV